MHLLEGCFFPVLTEFFSACSSGGVSESFSATDNLSMVSVEVLWNCHSHFPVADYAIHPKPEERCSQEAGVIFSHEPVRGVPI